MATLRNTAISLLRLTGYTSIAAALRHHAPHPGSGAEHRRRRLGGSQPVTQSQKPPQRVDGGRV